MRKGVIYSILIILCIPLMAQVKIKEKVGIRPVENVSVNNNSVESTSTLSTWPENGVVYLRYGGVLSIDTVKTPFIVDEDDHENCIFCNDTMYFDNGNKQKIYPKTLGEFSQWASISQGKWKCWVGVEDFRDTSGYFTSGIIENGSMTGFIGPWSYWEEICNTAYGNYCRELCERNGGNNCDEIGDNDKCCFENTERVEFITDALPGYIQYKLIIDSSLAAIPSSFIMERLGNPFTDTESWTVPTDGELYLIVDELKNSATPNRIRMVEPVDSLIPESLGEIVGTEKRMKRLKKGEKLKIALKSGNSIVSGHNIYNRHYSYFPDQDIEGSAYCYFDFEDWTDLTFGDVKCRLKFKPGNIADFPGSVYVKSETDTITYVDTTGIILMTRNESGGLESFPESKLYEVSILEGGEYCSIYSPQYGYESDYFASVPAGFKIVGDENPEFPVDVMIRVGDEVEQIACKVNPGSGNSGKINSSGSVSGTNTTVNSTENQDDKVYGFCRVAVIPTYYLTLKLSDDYPATGDTIDVIPLKITMEGDTVDFEPEQEFEVGVKEGCHTLEILTSEGETGQYFESIKMPIRAIIADSLDEDENDFSIKIAIKKDGKVKYIPMPQMCPTPPPVVEPAKANAEAETEGEDEPQMCPVLTFKENEQAVTTPGTAQQHTIMLGETKYYQLIFEEGCRGIEGLPNTGSPDKYYIKEATINDKGEPQLDADAIKSDVWGNNPVSYSTDKCGIYWEKKQPTFSENYEVKDGKDIGYQLLKPGYKALPNGLIRLIGRYWDYKGEIKYKVKLTANYNGNHSIEIEVVKPGKIGPVQNETNTKDVENKPMDLDELIIQYAGQYGVPPQIIKAIIRRESDFKNGYRWEPFDEASNNIHAKNSEYMNNNFRYRITNLIYISIGDPGLPATHTNIFPNSYWGYKGTIWDLFYSHCKFVNPSNLNSDLYPKKTNIWTNGAFSGYNAIYWVKYISAYSSFLINNVNNDNLNYVELVKYTNADDYAKNEALIDANNWLKNIWQNGRMGREVAQTRTASSYGLLQMKYTSAVYFTKYPMDYFKDIPEYLPEFLNTKLVFDYAIPYFAQNLNKELAFKENSKTQNWENGFENTFRIVSNSYNQGWSKKKIKRYTWGSKVTYGQQVIQFSTVYLPSK